MYLLFFFRKTTSIIFLQKIIGDLTSHNNLILIIYCKNIVDIIFISFFKETKKDKVMINYYYRDLNFFLIKSMFDLIVEIGKALQ